MRILAGVGLVLLFVAPAQACTKLPARSATKVPVRTADVGRTKTTTIGICGRALARATLTGSGTRRQSGARIGEASAAGNRVAWIEERHASGERTTVVSVYQAGRGIVRRFVSRSHRTAKTATLHVLLTRQGDLAWAAGTSGQRPHGDVVLERPGKPARRLDDEAIEGFKLEDDRTLVWSDYYELYFFDLRRKACPNRSRYKVRTRSDRFIVTSARYPDGFTDGAMTVYRGCDRKTGRDRVLASSGYEENAAPDGTFEIGEITGSWVTFLEGSYSPYGSSYDFTATNVISGRRTYCVVEPGHGAVITGGGTVAWIDKSTVRVCLDDKYTDVDSGGTLANLHVEGDTVVWTHDGVRRTHSQRPDG